MLLTNNHKNLILNNCTKQDIINYLNSAWETEDTLFKSIQDDRTFYLNPDSLRNPLIFYLGHSAVFYINKLLIVGLLDTGINPFYEKLYEMGVDPDTPDELQDEIASIQWHDVEKLWTYRHQARNLVINIIEKTPLELPITPESRWWAIIMGIEHQRIHIETSSMLIRQLPVELIAKPSSWYYASSKGKPPKNDMITVKGGVVNLGNPEKAYLYGWDVDFGTREVIVNDFAVSKYPITNDEFLQFVKSGGYQNSNYWQEEGWQWRETNQVTHPKFWILNQDSYRYRLMFDEIDLPLDFPVEVNHHEAIAFCNYYSQKIGQKCTMMSEAQWHLASGKNQDDENNYNLNLKYISPTPVGSIETAQSDEGIYDLRGNVWEWLADIFTPLTDFQPHYLYQDYSAPFFDNRHYLLKGGSWATNGYEATPYYRNWFRPHFFQHAGFRISNQFS
ncbi:5-histidylcysteine sulfoxide synthase [Cyanobacterium aponinum FACHB-4101]|uniref:5-histidylcysteine sulfoxide synthase n=1 Tax=Cyanobacterium aponinum TaxID=379064 RepID=UPI00167FFD39|nr:5-histidylcysteine sulfoxide synthase [Cyanobacterium aponinum]MBD2395416.1 5-histidylcysteine sulfoxide synthase [Cyanobacterium aponinum FACHB-4101]